MIFFATVGAGMLLFQLLIWWEAYRQFVRQFERDVRGPWFVLPRAERSYMRRRPGAQTVMNEPGIWAEIIQYD